MHTDGRPGLRVPMHMHTPPGARLSSSASVAVEAERLAARGRPPRTAVTYAASVSVPVVMPTGFSPVCETVGSFGLRGWSSARGDSAVRIIYLPLEACSYLCRCPRGRRRVPDREATPVLGVLDTAHSRPTCTRCRDQLAIFDPRSASPWRVYAGDAMSRYADSVSRSGASRRADHRDQRERRPRADDQPRREDAPSPPTAARGRT